MKSSFAGVHHFSKGLSLIEVMVSMVIGLFLVLGASTVYLNSRKSADVDDAVARLQETARYALGVLETDVRMANYYGLLKDGIRIEGKANATDTKSSLINGTGADACANNFAVNTEAYVAADNNNYGYTCGAEPGNAVGSADTLTVRRASTSTATLTPTSLQICSTRSSATLITGGTACASADSGNGEIRDMEVDAYYVDQESDQSSTVPSLRRKTLIDGPTFRDVEIAPGVEDMQVQFGWDSSGSTGEATQYVNPDSAVLASGQIVSVRIWLLIRADATDATYTDTRTYEYGDRSTANGTATTLSAAGSAKKAYAPNDHYRRVLVSKTIFLRNVVGT